MPLELALIVAPDAHRRLVDLAETLAEEIEDVGLAASVRRDAIPSPGPELVPVLFDPGELRVGRFGRSLSRALLGHSIVVLAGRPRPGGPIVSAAAAAFELDPASDSRRRLAGEPGERLGVGWSRRWDAPLEAERDLDLAIVGARTEAQFRRIAARAGELTGLRVEVAPAADPEAPDGGPHGDAGAAERVKMLARTKVIVDLERRHGPRLESVRAAEAISAGAVVVCEHAPDLSPLKPERDYLAASNRDPVDVALELLADGRRRTEIQRTAKQAISDRVPLSRAAQRLAEVAESVAIRGGKGRRPGARRLAGTPDVPPAVVSPPPVSTDPDSAAARRRLKRVRLAEIELARELDALAVRLRGEQPGTRLVTEAEGGRDSEPRVSVIVTLFNYEREIEGALSSVVASEYDELELVIVDDASNDGSRERAKAWVESHPSTPSRLYAHASNRGLPSARNTAVGHARGELIFVLDADNRVLPHGIGRLVEALDADPGAAFAYGISQRIDEEGKALGLMNVGGWDPARLRHVNYIDAMAMIRAVDLRGLGGYTTELSLYGWEDYDLWCRMAERGMRGAYVPEIVAVYRESLSGMAWSVSNISTTDAYRAVIARAPRVMAGVRPPA